VRGDPQLHGDVLAPATAHLPDLGNGHGLGRESDRGAAGETERAGQDRVGADEVDGAAGVCLAEVDGGQEFTQMQVRIEVIVCGGRGQQPINLVRGLYHIAPSAVAQLESRAAPTARMRRWRRSPGRSTACGPAPYVSSTWATTWSVTLRLVRLTSRYSGAMPDMFRYSLTRRSFAGDSISMRSAPRSQRTRSA
jgi:hypothetical protein